MSQKYRPDIDGLRAAAVLGVLFFHLGIWPFTGGFVGVDVFFVISGFLITRLIRNEVQATGGFDFAQFYVRRVRRLFPAMFFTLLVSFIAAAFLLSPQDMQEFGSEAIHAILSVSNIYFWQTTNYFNASALPKPLLHTWSLGVEEQFYLVWPVLIVFLVAKGPRWGALAAVIALTAISLAGNIVMQDGYCHILSLLVPNFAALFTDGASTIFYLLPFRVFELGIGAAMVWLTEWQPARAVRLEPAVLAGTALVLFSMLTYTEAMVFPSVNALVPCLGAALIIYGGTARYSGRIFRARPMVHIGRISYSLYLIHWPIIVFVHFWDAALDGWLVKLAIVAGSVAAAELMYRYIETPFRRGVRSNEFHGLSGVVAVLLVVLLILPAAQARSTGWAWRFPPNAQQVVASNKEHLDGYVWREMNEYEGKAFKNDSKPNVLVIGDSMAANLTNMLVETRYVDKIDLSASIIAANCVIAFSDDLREFDPLIKPDQRERCLHFRENAQHWITLENADYILIASSWRWGGKYMEQTINFIKKRSSAKIGVLGAVAQEESGFSLIPKISAATDPWRIRTSASNHTKTVNANLRSNAKGYRFIDLLEDLCDEKGCRRADASGNLIMYDVEHLTREGAFFLGERALAPGGAVYNFLHGQNGASVVSSRRSNPRNPPSSD